MASIRETVVLRFESADTASDLRMHAVRYLQCEFIAGTPAVMATTPSGRPVLVFSLGEAPEAAVGATPLQQQSRATVRGQCTAPVQQRFSPGHRCFMVVLRPTGLRSLLGVSACTFTDAHVDVRASGAASARALVELSERLQSAVDFTDRCQEADTILRQVAAAQPASTSRVVAAAVHQIDAAIRTVGLGDLAQGLAVSPRTLRRRFLETVGLPPRTFASITRFRRVVADLHGGRDSGWLDLVHRHGYSDQSHLGREFRRFAGLCPSDYHPGQEILDRELNTTS